MHMLCYMQYSTEWRQSKGGGTRPPLLNYVARNDIIVRIQRERFIGHAYHSALADL